MFGQLPVALLLAMFAVFTGLPTLSTFDDCTPGVLLPLDTEPLLLLHFLPAVPGGCFGLWQPTWSQGFGKPQFGQCSSRGIWRQNEDKMGEPQPLELPAAVAPLELPAAVPPLELPAAVPPLELPAAVPPLELPAAVPPLELPAAVPPLELPAAVPPLELPAAVPPLELPAAVPAEEKAEVCE